METNDKERKDYRRMLHEAVNEFEEIYRYDRFSFINAKRLFYRILKVLTTHDRTASAELIARYEQKDIRDLTDCEPEIRPQTIAIRKEIATLKHKMAFTTGLNKVLSSNAQKELDANATLKSANKGLMRTDKAYRYVVYVINQYRIENRFNWSAEDVLGVVINCCPGENETVDEWLGITDADNGHKAACVVTDEFPVKIEGPEAAR